MSACPSYPTLVALWAGELEESEAAAIDEHLFGCDPCAAATERLAKVVGTLSDADDFRVTPRPRPTLLVRRDGGSHAERNATVVRVRTSLRRRAMVGS